MLLSVMSLSRWAQVLAIAFLSTTGLAADKGEPIISAASHLRHITFDSERDAVIPHVADGGGWRTSLILMNPGKTSLSALVGFYSDTGSLLSLPIAQLQNDRSSVLSVSLAPGASVVIDTSDIDSTVTQGYAIAAASDPSALLTGMAVFRQRISGRPDFEAVVPISPYNEVDFTMPFDNRDGFSTGIAVVNPDDPPAPASTLTLYFYDPKGNQILRDSIVLAPGAHTAFSIPSRWPSLAAKNGLLLAHSDGRMLSSLGLRFNPSGAFTSFHALSLAPANQSGGTAPTVPPTLPGISSACSAIEGASLYAQDNRYLGIISSNRYLADSLSNEYGQYGSSYNASSIFNRYGQYGSDYSSLSPFNQYASQPPIIAIQGKASAYLTTNGAKTPRVDTLAMLNCIGRPR